MGIYTNPEIHIGHASYIVLLDAIARYREKFLHEEVFFPSHSFNVYGQRADRLAPKNASPGEFMVFLDQRAEEIIKKAKRRTKLNLSSHESVAENEPIVVQGIQADFMKLYKLKYIFEREKEYYLDCPKILENFPVNSLLKEIRYHPPRIASEFERISSENTRRPVKVTRLTQYSASNPLDPNAEKIGPLFLLANLWEHKYPSDYKIFAGSYNALTRYLFLRMLCQIPLHQRTGIDELVIYPKIFPEGGVEAWDLDKIKNKYEADMIRYTLLSSYSEHHEKVNLQLSRLNGGRNFVHLLANLGKVFAKEENTGLIMEQIYPDYPCDMENLKFPKVISTLESILNKLSMKINQSKRSKTFDLVNKKLASQYHTLMKLAEPITPAICKFVEEAKCIPIK